MESHVLECVVFELTADADRDDFVAAASSVTEWARTQPGFAGRELYEVGDGRWIDTVRWATLADAHAAASAIGASPVTGDFLAKIHGPSVQVLHGRPVLDRP